ncbi:MAG: hypothetical protein K6F88_04510 [Ruminococcus sp.]|nr:hypothetical protein [Ruminococcus sp.]
MEKPYIAPFVEFISIYGDALQGSTEQSSENRSYNAKDIFENPDNPDDWFLF